MAVSPMKFLQEVRAEAQKAIESLKPAEPPSGGRPLRAGETIETPRFVLGFDPKTGAIVKTEKITDTDDLNDAEDQKAAMAKAKTSLVAAADAAVKENSGFRAVSVFPDLRDGHAIADVTLLQGTTAKKVTEKLD